MMAASWQMAGGEAEMRLSNASNIHHPAPGENVGCKGSREHHLYDHGGKVKPLTLALFSLEPRRKRLLLDDLGKLPAFS